MVLSKFYNKLHLPFLASQNVATYSPTIGIDYLEKDWFYLSSQIGYLNIGGKEENLIPPLIPEKTTLKEQRGFLHLNTTFRAFLKLDDAVRIFLGTGPSVNVLMGPKPFKADPYRVYHFNSVVTLLKSEIGVTQDYKKIRIGMSAAYSLNLTPTATSGYLDLKNHIISASFSMGYFMN